MTVLEHVGRAHDAPGLYIVVSTHEYLVDIYEKTCECPDFQYRENVCKYLRCTMFATGMRPPIPGWVACEAICDQLLEARHVDGEPYFSGEGECKEIDTDAAPHAIADGG